MKRLAYIKHLYSLAIAQSRLSEFFAPTAVLLFHDSVELFFELAASVRNQFPLGNPTRKNVFIWKYFDFVLSDTNERPKREAEIVRLNNVRNDLKHQGQMPSMDEIERLRVGVTNFFEENTPLLFGIEFSDVSLISLISNAKVREHLEAALRAREQQDWQQVLTDTAIAFVQVVEQYEGVDADSFEHSSVASPVGLFRYSSAVRDLLVGNGRSRPNVDISAIMIIVQHAERALSDMQQAINIMGLGINFASYLRYRKVAPSVVRIGHSEKYVVQYSANRPQPSWDTVDFCLNFVIESTLNLQQTFPGEQT